MILIMILWSPCLPSLQQTCINRPLGVALAPESRISGGDRNMYSVFQGKAVVLLTRCTSMISIIGCSIVAMQCWKLKQEKKLTNMDKLILVLCLVDLGLAISWFVGDWSKDNHFACNFQVRSS